MPFLPSALALLHKKSFLFALISSVRSSKLPVPEIYGNLSRGEWTCKGLYDKSLELTALWVQRDEQLPSMIYIVGSL